LKINPGLTATAISSLECFDNEEDNKMTNLKGFAENNAT